MPVPHDSAYQLLVDTHIGLGSSSEAWALLQFLAHAAWQPPDAAFMSLLATACGTESYGVPQVWLAFKLRGALPGGVCCNCFIAAAAAASTPGSGEALSTGTCSDCTCMVHMHSTHATPGVACHAVHDTCRRRWSIVRGCCLLVFRRDVLSCKEACVERRATRALTRTHLHLQLCDLDSRSTGGKSATDVACTSTVWNINGAGI